MTLIGSRVSFLGSPITTTHSGEAMGWPSAPRAMRWSTTIWLRASMRTPEVSSEPDPRCTIIALSVRPVERSAAWKPSDIDMSTAMAATTSAMPRHRQQRHLPAHAHVADVVVEGERHGQTVLSMSVMRER